jgi:hypothetical protein
MSDAIASQQLYTILTGIPNIGMVHSYERWAVNWDKFIELFKDPASGRILGWEIGKEAMLNTRISNLEEERTHRYVVKGYMGVKDADATDSLFNAMIETIADTFKGNLTLGGTVMDAGPASARVIDTRMFGGVLCHYTEIEIPVTEIV